MPDAARHHYDVILIGAGPAGAACALALRHSGLRVALLDKARFPRDKVCGDAIPGPALKALRKLSEDFYQELRTRTPRADTQTSRLVAPDGGEARVQWQLPTFSSPRLHFDHHLLNLVRRHTSTEIRENYAVRDVQTDAHCATVFPADGSPPLTAALVLGCDGANSVVARKLLPRPLDRRYHCAAVRAYYRGISGTNEQTTEFFFLKEHLAGYLWIFPVGPDGTCNVGFGMVSDQIAAGQVNLKETMQEVLRQHPALAPRFAQAEQLTPIVGFGLPLGGTPRPSTGPRFLLCGDAASLIDPLQGHGIDTAIESGVLAAAQVQRCFAQQDFSAAFLQQYEREVEEKIGRKLTRSYRLMRFFADKPWVVNAGFRVARQPLVKKWMLKLVG
ncbi:geranylgeranyl reductase family [Hymenobacter daecheongensis DSM 21074]|uniref:Geranylgeranyl reductase family n=1 Tax=Hymenobacter daecheongensis DSM 21074 TaxID=1121955 RepID=A0A1M6CG92_9BACT|nr:geranylgeranyl reductase family protein [Hymenobacter daecheongensis]SHI60029.1 geranylgeranyl reductase family [Hymenobacter daecheongensis DSM 21074]